MKKMSLICALLSMFCLTFCDLMFAKSESIIQSMSEERATITWVNYDDCRACFIDNGESSYGQFNEFIVSSTFRCVRPAITINF